MKKHTLGWIGGALILFGYYLNANMNPTCWPVWIVGNSLIGVYSLKNEAYPTAAMSFVLVAFAIYGYILWLNVATDWL